MNSLANEWLPQGGASLAADPALPVALPAPCTTGSVAAMAPDPEVAAVAKRRQYPNAEKRRILSAADRCKKPGEMSAVAIPKRGPKANPVLAHIRREAQLERELDRQRRRLAQADAHNLWSHSGDGFFSHFVANAA